MDIGYDDASVGEDRIQRTATLKARMKLLEVEDAEPELTNLFQCAAEIIEKENQEPEQVAKPPLIVDKISQGGVAMIIICISLNQEPSFFRS